MKKTLLVVFLAVMALVFANGVSNAALTGACGSCHTMHNSQNGTAVALDDNGVTTGTARDYLLKGSCAFCHIGTDSTSKTTATGGWNVRSTTAGFPSGYFSATGANTHVTTETAVAPITATESYFTTSTPGDSAAAAPVQGSNNLGCTDCHNAGGGHHGGSTYRLVAGVTGLKADLSQSNMETTANHNVVLAAGLNTMCATCHVDFVGAGNVGGPHGTPFTRHPVGNPVTDDWATPTVSYNNNPWGFSDIAGLSTATAYTDTNGQVLCVSCHRAHGSGESDNLRFTYSSQNAGTAGTGCQGCHNK